jgi:transposase
MVDKEFIRKKHFVEGWSIRKIARNLGFSRPSVRKALADAEVPQYRLTKPRPCPVMDPYREIVIAWLKADQQAPPKQRHTAKRIYDRLVEEYGFIGGESTVRRFVRQLRVELGDVPEAYIPLTADWGEQAQVDWGQAWVCIAGQETLIHLFCLRMKASTVPFAYAFPTEKLEGFLAGHRMAFEWLGGMPAQCVYDNPKTAVVKILAGPYREEHIIFSSLRAHYLFDSEFCNPAQGHEKGSVENLVGYVRRNALVPVRDFSDWDELNEHLLRWSTRERNRHHDRWEKEQAALRPLPEKPFPCTITRLAVVSKTSLVTFDRNRYSVPCQLVGQTVQIAATWDCVRVAVKGKVVAEHRRRYGRGETIVELLHYLPVLARKPRASNHALAVRRLGRVWTMAREHLLRASADGYRELTRILMLHQEFQAADVARALEQALAIGSPTASMVRQLILNTDQKPLLTVKAPANLSRFTVTPPDLSRYDQLARGASQ